MTELKFKPGDHVMVPMVVEKVLDDNERLYRVHLRDHVKASGFYVPEPALASATLIERPLAVGDRVELHTKDGRWMPCVIKAIDGDRAWVRGPEVDWIPALSELRRAEERG